MNNRVVITGMGVVSPLGISLDQFWNAVLAGQSGVGAITRFDVSAFPTKIAAEVKGFNPVEHIDKKEARRMDLSEQYAMVATDQAIRDAGIDTKAIDLDRCGVVIGSGIGGISTFEKQHSLLKTSGPGRVSPFFIPMMIIDMCAGLVSIKYGFRGPNYATVSACASSAHAIGDAFRIIQRGEADIMIAGGAEATITPTALAGFCQAKALSTRNDEPERASRPFDRDRDGFVMGEGAAILVLESYEMAKARGARIYAELKGAGSTADAFHMTAPHPEGYGARKSIELALKDAGISGEQVDYVNTHGTSTDLGDISETKAIKEVLGEHAYRIPINSTKSMIGHLLGAAGAIELVVTAKSIQEQAVHPTVNLDNPDPECDLDYVPGHKRASTINNAISNSFGFGGHNVTLVIGRVDGAA
ncbi:MAG: beta-ketoacyl-ACP synthase II [Candidatus Zixiibacteriota bacterium]|nr:MAG: beta-ketoacyl-ACP synthase II [candidate division Zixibacteria bacterium]